MSDQVLLLKKFLLNLAPLPETEWERLLPRLRLATLNTGDNFVSSGQSPERVGFITEGLIKSSYITQIGEEYIRNFSYENSFAMALTSLLVGSTESDFTIVALEPCKLVCFSFSDYREMLPAHWTWQQIGRIMAERHYVMRERRQFQLLTMPAEQRLDQFLTEHPNLRGRVSQKDIAAYLGITPVSLSRIRAKRHQSF